MKKYLEKVIPSWMNYAAICLLTLLLSAFGLVMIHAASLYAGIDMDYLTNRQITYLILGAVVLILCQSIPLHIWEKAAPFFMGVGIAAVFLLMTPLGRTVNGVRRWLSIGYVNFPPAYLVVWGYILWIAFILIKDVRREWKFGFGKLLWGSGIITSLIVWKLSDTAAAAVIIMFITFGVSIACQRHILAHVLGLVSFAVLTVGVPAFLSLSGIWSDTHYFTQRYLAWLDPYKYRNSTGYYTCQSLDALKNAGLFGHGYGNGTMGLSASDASSDMIFAVTADELGWIGALAMLAVFAVLCYQIFRVAKLAYETEEYFGSVLVFGVMVHIGISVIYNVAVCLNLIPNAGMMVLPFVGFSGMSLVFLFGELGCVLSVLRKCGKMVDMPE